MSRFVQVLGFVWQLIALVAIYTGRMDVALYMIASAAMLYAHEAAYGR